MIRWARGRPEAAAYPPNPLGFGPEPSDTLPLIAHRVQVDPEFAFFLRITPAAAIASAHWLSLEQKAVARQLDHDLLRQLGETDEVWFAPL